MALGWVVWLGGGSCCPASLASLVGNGKAGCNLVSQPRSETVVSWGRNNYFNRHLLSRPERHDVTTCSFVVVAAVGRGGRTPSGGRPVNGSIIAPRIAWNDCLWLAVLGMMNVLPTNDKWSRFGFV